MKKLLILGAGTAGTLIANKMRSRLPEGWGMTVVDPAPRHLYQPGLIFVPFGTIDEGRLERRRERTLRSGVDWVREGVEAIEPDHRRVVLEGGESLEYDLLVIATGTEVRPEETEGLVGDHWGRTAHEFYTLEGAVRLRDAISRFEGGRLVLNIVEMPIKCPVAPLEFLFLADDHFTRRGIRDRVDLTLVTPLDGAFTRPLAADLLGALLESKGIGVETEFSTGSVDGEKGVLSSWDEREIEYDLLVSIPTHMGASFVEGSGLGNELGFVRADHHTLQARDHDDIFVIGDAADLPTSKAGSVAHFQGATLEENLQRAMNGRSLEKTFDGHANCFIETGFGKAVLIDFNYEVEPLPGQYPMPLAGPFSLMKETRRNHWGKLGFEWLYWHALLPGLPMPVSDRLSMVGKRVPAGASAGETPEAEPALD